jgi:hypothetical protein
MSDNPLYGQLLERVIAQQPELAQYTELFSQLGNNTTTVSDETVAIKARLGKVNAIAKRLKNDLADALDDLDELAKALGACDACWGRDNRCPICRGDGIAGYFKPDKALFNQMILPALHKAQWLEVIEK